MVAAKLYEQGHDLTLPPPVYEIHYAPPEYDTPDARHKLEKRVMTWIDLDQWMQRRVRYFGAPCLTGQEYRAVLYSLRGLPDVRLIDGRTPIELELPTQKYVAAVMHLSEGRVSQLLKSASQALRWFAHQETHNVGWYAMKHGRGVDKWHFEAPVLEHPMPPDPERRRTTVDVIRQGRVYKLRFAGEAA